VHTDYEALADRYDEDRAQWAVPRDDVVEKALIQGSTARVLDVGCGTGTWLAAQRDFFGDAGVEWVGADPSEAMLRVAEQKGLRKLVRAGAEALPLSSTVFDYVACSFMFHHVIDKESALDEVDRVLKPTGFFRLNNIEPAAPNGWWLYEFFPGAIAIDAARFWPAERVADALHRRHYEVDIELEENPTQSTATDALAEAERRVISQLALLDDDEYAQGIIRLREAAMEPTASMLSTWSKLQITAQKAG